jgi:hypothetical protein
MKAKTVSQVSGYILISPAVFSVFAFLIDLITDWTLLHELSDIWTGIIYDSGYGDNNIAAGFTSALPFYFGLMAIAGAYLIKDNNKD